MFDFFKRILALTLSLMIMCSTALAYEGLGVGSKGEAVKKMQTRLTELGYYNRSIDGDYGNLTKTAVKDFQAANGLKPNGEATADVLKLMYSNKAKSAPLPPDVEVTGIQYRSKNGNVKLTIKNNLSEPIVFAKLSYLTLNNSGQVRFQYNTIDDIDNELLFSTTSIDKYIQPGKTTSVSGYLATNISVLAAGVSEYHTASGKKVRLAKDQITYLTSTGDTIYPTRDPQMYTILSNGEYERARQVMLGLTYYFIPDFAETQYMIPSGKYVTQINEGSLADLAGLAVGDVITELADISASEPYSDELCKLKMLDGETITVTYWRANQSHTTQLSLDMKDLTKKESSYAVTTIADELLTYASLLEKGLITQEEYDLLKQKLLSE